MTSKTQGSRAHYVLIDEAERISFVVTYLLRSSGLMAIATSTPKQQEYLSTVLPHFNIPESRYRVVLFHPLDQAMLQGC